jgi:hypothetical protein
MQGSPTKGGARKKNQQGGSRKVVTSWIVLS